MNDSTRDVRLVETFAKLADTLVDDFDVVDLLQLLVETCAEALDTTAAGILLTDRGGQLELVASTSESTRLVEAMQLSAEAGPCIQSFETGHAVSVPDIAAEAGRWPAFALSAGQQGFRSAHAVPMRLRDNRLGTLNLLRDTEGVLDPVDALAAQALADVATIGILQHRAISDSTALATQLQHALNSRVVIEQAKGVLSHTHGVTVDRAFDLMRAYSRNNNTPISQVAARIVDRSLDL